MRIAIIGAGSVGTALGLRWSAAGHAVSYGVPNPYDRKYAHLSTGRVLHPANAASGADAIVLATPWEATEQAVRGLGSLGGRLVIDCTNPLTVGPGGMQLAIGHDVSGAELVARWAPGALVFKAFNQTGANVMQDPAAFGRPVMFVAGDDAAHKPAVMGLVRDVGFEAIDAGALSAARLLEPLAMLWIELALHRLGRDFALTLVRK